jgi:hypothetical protein
MNNSCLESKLLATFNLLPLQNNAYNFNMQRIVSGYRFLVHLLLFAPTNLTLAGEILKNQRVLFITTAGVNDSQSVVQNSIGDSRIRVPMNQETVATSLLAIGPDGEIEEKIVIGFLKNLEGSNKSEHDERKRSAAIPESNLPNATNTQSTSVVSASNSKYSLASGFSFAHYTQSFASNVSMLLLSTQAKFTRAIQPEKFDFGVDANIAFPLVFTTDAAKASFLNLAARFGFQVPHSLQPNWLIRIDASTFFDTMKVKSNQYGYNNLVGFALSPEIRHTYNSGTLSLFMKFAMSLNDFPHSLGSGEYTLGSRWQLRNSTGVESWAVFASASYLRLIIGEVRISITTLSLGAALDFD